ncbi:hypothetical protein ACN9MN_05500 [Chryseobacterium sp. S-02]|uniref:hypothetical protein n=1 Tax=Chryseobacterium sp. S-02 TaxID=3404064 RepID=UPI003CF61357
MRENDLLKSTVLHYKNNYSENETDTSEEIGSYGAAFLIRSLEKIKKNTESEVFKKLINTYIEEYLFHIKDNNHHTIINDIVETSVKDSSFILYAKTAYNKVLKEEECLSRLLDTLERNNIEKCDLQTKP